ncbi:mCG1037744, partial [Mus musculus]
AFPKYFRLLGRKIQLNIHKASAWGTRYSQASTFGYAWLELMENFHPRIWGIRESPEFLTGCWDDCEVNEARGIISTGMALVWLNKAK